MIKSRSIITGLKSRMVTKMGEHKLKKFLDQVSGKEGDDIINGLDVGQIEVLMSLPEFDSDKGLSETVHNVQEALIAKGHAITDESVVALFDKGCLKWVQDDETFLVCESLRGKECKDAIVKRYNDLRRGGDGSASFKELLGECGSR